MGDRYCGWQKQAERLSVQEVIEKAIKERTKQEVQLVAAGRTDAGVHAAGQVAHFDLDEFYEPYKLTASLNFFMRGEDIGIIKSELASENFNARFSAKQRHYVYKILNRPSINIIYAKHKTFVRKELDCSKMQEAANHLIGTHDFTSFRDSFCQSRSPIKTLDRIEIVQHGDDIEIHFSALSFLHHMVRNIVGTLINVGTGKWEPDYVLDILEKKTRTACGPTAPATGLYFLKVDY
jgi:tRNA pseudouridine38-40 synthase